MKTGCVYVHCIHMAAVESAFTCRKSVFFTTSYTIKIMKPFELYLQCAV